jgi:hypothetical protein
MCHSSEEEIGNWCDHANLLGTGLGDRFKVFQGGSGRFGEEVRRREEAGLLQEKSARKRCSLAV